MISLIKKELVIRKQLLMCMTLRVMCVTIQYIRNIMAFIIIS